MNRKEQPQKHAVRLYLYRGKEKDERVVIVSNGRSTAAQVASLHSIDAVSARLKAEVEQMETERRKGEIVL